MTWRGFVLIAALAAPSGWALAKGADEVPEWNPPARYDRPYRGQLTVTRLPQRQVPAACAALFKGGGYSLSVSPFQRGCALRGRGWCRVIIIDKTYLRATPEAVLRHEIGHCNGWPADHPEE